MSYKRNYGGTRSARRIKELLRELEYHEIHSVKEPNNKDHHEKKLKQTTESIIAVLKNRNEQGYYD